jgi:microcompartment protein CcmK/EutM
MVLGKVTGTIVSTIKYPAYKGLKIMIIQPLDADGEDNGEDFLAFDTVQSGVGDTVLVLREGTGSRQIMGKGEMPYRSMVVGIVDAIDVACFVGRA